MGIGARLLLACWLARAHAKLGGRRFCARWRARSRRRRAGLKVPACGLGMRNAADWRVGTRGFCARLSRAHRWLWRASARVGTPARRVHGAAALLGHYFGALQVHPCGLNPIGGFRTHDPQSRCPRCHYPRCQHAAALEAGTAGSQFQPSSRPTVLPANVLTFSPPLLLPHMPARPSPYVRTPDGHVPTTVSNRALGGSRLKLAAVRATHYACTCPAHALPFLLCSIS